MHFAPPHGPAHGNGAFRERRSAPRRRRNVRVLFLSNDSVLEEPYGAMLLDCSVGGLRLLVRLDVEEGEVLMVRPPSAPAGTPWVPVKVRNRRLGRDSCEVGCQFTPSLAGRLLQLFVT
jgi:hypothetical protein